MLLWAGQTISMTGSAVTTVALPLVAITMLQASVVQVGLLTAATYVAFILVSLPAGVAVDRLPKRKIMIWCDCSRLVIIGSVPVGLLHRLTLGQLYAVALTAGACAVFFDVSQQSYVSSLLHQDDLMEGFGKLGASASFAEVSGTGLASGLVAVIGAARAVVADALSYAVSVACLISIRGTEPRPESKSPGTRKLRQDIIQGLIFISHHRILRKTTACAATGNLFLAMEISLNLLFLFVSSICRPPWRLFYCAGQFGGHCGRHACRIYQSPCRIGPRHLGVPAGVRCPVAHFAASRTGLEDSAVCVGLRYFCLRLRHFRRIAANLPTVCVSTRAARSYECGQPVDNLWRVADRRLSRRDPWLCHWDSHLNLDCVYRSMGFWPPGLLLTFAICTRRFRSRTRSGPLHGRRQTEGRSIAVRGCFREFGRLNWLGSGGGLGRSTGVVGASAAVRCKQHCRAR